MMMDLVHVHNYCISYRRTLLLETAIANAVVENTKKFDGIYVPPFLKKCTFIFFAIDNTDFAEDTLDNKGTTHGTITAVYQKADAPGEPIAPVLELSDAQNLSVLPYHIPIEPCSKPKPGPDKREQKFEVSSTCITESHEPTTLGWMIASALLRSAENGPQCKIPGWAGYKSLVSSGRPLTQVGALSLLPKVAHEWSTMLTVMLQASQLKSLVVGQDHPTVITFDMALYEKAVQLVDARPNLKSKIVPRLGELHAVMAALRALGTSIENSGIDDAWIEADVYGPATTRQILKCSHYKRALRVHTHTYMALYELALEQFFTEMPHPKEVCSKPAEEGHHDVQPTVVRQEHEAVDKIKAAILSHGNPFAVEGNQLYNFITHAYVPQEYVPQILNVDDISQKLYKDYVTERINGDVSLWAPVKKQNNKIYMSGNKKHTVKVHDQTVELKETKNLYGRLMVLTRSNRDIDQKNAIGDYEFTLTPRTLFAPDGSMLPCTDKSKLIHNLEKLAKIDDTEIPAANEYGDSSATSSTNPKIAIVDGMVLSRR